MKNQREIGQSFEKLAGAYLSRQGYEILEYNFHCRRGEIDIIAQEGETIVFCEVKYRKTGCSGHPLEAVTISKQRKICKTAMYYLVTHGKTAVSCRFDVIGIQGEEIVLVKNAFEYIG